MAFVVCDLGKEHIPMIEIMTKSLKGYIIFNMLHLTVHQFSDACL